MKPVDACEISIHDIGSSAVHAIGGCVDGSRGGEPRLQTLDLLNKLMQPGAVKSVRSRVILLRSADLSKVARELADRRILPLLALAAATVANACSSRALASWRVGLLEQ